MATNITWPAAQRNVQVPYYILSTALCCIQVLFLVVNTGYTVFVCKAYLEMRCNSFKASVKISLTLCFCISNSARSLLLFLEQAKQVSVLEEDGRSHHLLVECASLEPTKLK